MRSFLTCVLLVGLGSATALGQSATSGSVQIVSSPPGCTVYLTGETEIITTTPAQIPGGLRGTYLVHATRPGYERWHQAVVFDPGAPQTLAIDLVPKTRIKAAMRSLVIPGWGQFYAEEKGRGTFWGLSVLVSGVVGTIYELRYQDRKDEWEDGLDRFRDATSVSEKEQVREEVLRLQDRAYDAESTRRLVWSITAGIWAANVVDALVFFPADKRFAGLPLTATPGFIDGSPGAYLSITF